MFALSLAPRLYQLDNRSIWMDEDRQAEIAGRGFDLDLVSRAAEQHQPPIDYYAEAIGLALFGVTEHGARVHAALFGALASALLFFLLGRLFHHPLPVLLGTAMFVFDVYMVRYSQEGRPISCGVFFTVLYLVGLHTYLFPRTAGSAASGETPARFFARELLRGVLLFTAVLLFFLSVGFQPIVFVAVSTVALLPGLLRRRLRWRIALVVGITVLAFLAALPILQESMGHGRELIGTASLWDRITGVVESLGAFDKASWWGKYDRLIPHHQTLVAVLALPALLGWLIEWKKNRRHAAVAGGLYLLAFALLYPPAFDIVYRSQISWKVQTRYFLTFQPVLVTGIAGAVFFAVRAVTRVTRHRFAMARWAFCLVVLALFIQAEKQNGITLQAVYQRQERTDWRSLYALFNREGKPRDTAFIMNLTRIDRWSPRFYATQFYYSHRPRQVRLNPLENLPILYARERLNKKHNLFLVTPYGNEKLTADHWQGVQEVAFHRFHKLAVIQVKSRIRMKPHIVKVFDILTGKLTKEESNFRVWHIFAQLKLADGDLPGAAALIQDLRAMDKRRKLSGPVIRPLMRVLNRKQKALRASSPPDPATGLPSPPSLAPSSPASATGKSQGPNDDQSPGSAKRVSAM